MGGVSPPSDEPRLKAGPGRHVFSPGRNVGLVWGRIWGRGTAPQCQGPVIPAPGGGGGGWRGARGRGQTKRRSWEPAGTAPWFRGSQPCEGTDRSCKGVCVVQKGLQIVFLRTGGLDEFGNRTREVVLGIQAPETGVGGEGWGQSASRGERTASGAAGTHPRPRATGDRARAGAAHRSAQPRTLGSTAGEITGDPRRDESAQAAFCKMGRGRGPRGPPSTRGAGTHARQLRGLERGPLTPAPVALGKPLYLHMGEETDGVDMRAEVGLLSRNIVVMGEVEGSCYPYASHICSFFDFDTFGGHIKVRVLTTQESPRGRPGGDPGGGWDREPKAGPGEGTGARAELSSRQLLATSQVMGRPRARPPRSHGTPCSRPSWLPPAATAFVCSPVSPQGPPGRAGI